MFILKKEKINNVLLVTITSNRGLCGGFNSFIIKQTKTLIKNEYRNTNVSILSIGKKSSEHFTKNNFNVVGAYDDLLSDITYDGTCKIAEKIMIEFVDGKYDKVVVVYNQFKNAATQIVMTENFLPLENEEKAQETPFNYLFEPSQESIVEELIPRSLKTQLFKAVLDSNASEHGARMTAMHKATDNASELKKELTLTYNKARQAAITGEILEIVGGAEALKG